jgi:hypothetical protein
MHLEEVATVFCEVSVTVYQNTWHHVQQAVIFFAYRVKNAHTSIPRRMRVRITQLHFNAISYFKDISINVARLNVNCYLVDRE